MQAIWNLVGSPRSGAGFLSACLAETRAAPTARLETPAAPRCRNERRSRANGFGRTEMDMRNSLVQSLAGKNISKLSQGGLDLDQAFRHTGTSFGRGTTTP